MPASQKSKPAAKKAAAPPPAKKAKPAAEKAATKGAAKKAVPAKGKAVVAAKGKGKAPAAPAKGKAAPKPKKVRLSQQKRLRMIIERPAKVFRIGQSLAPKKDMSRLVKWPKYIKMQRQRRILLKRLKMPPALNQFNHTLDKATATSLFKLLLKYRPEERAAKVARHEEAAKVIAEAKKADEGKKKRTALKEALGKLEKPYFLKKGLNHVTTLVERCKAQLVIIAHDVDPIELVVWLPALCRKKKVPYVIVKSKSRLGALVHKKTASCLALCGVNKEDRAEFESVLEVARSQFNDNHTVLKQYSEQKFGNKHRQQEAKKLKRIQKAEAGKLSA